MYPNEENFQQESPANVLSKQGLAVFSELEQLEKKSSMAFGRAESLYSRLRSVMSPTVQPVGVDTPMQSEPEMPTDQQRIAKRMMNVKRVIQTTIDLMSEIEARLEL